MDNSAWILMVASEGIITFAVIYYFAKVLRTQKKKQHQ